MNRSQAIIAVVAGVALAAWGARSLAHEGHHEVPKAPQAAGEKTPGHSHEQSELHGGEAAMTKAHHFETVWTPDGLRIYVYTGEQAPAMVEKATGSVTFHMKDGTSKVVPLAKQAPDTNESPAVYFCPMHPEVVQSEPGICTLCGSMKLFTQDRLFAPMDLAKAEPGTVKAVVKLSGLQGAEKETTLTASFTGFPKKPGVKAAEAHSHH
jgi:hypothetical protein